MQRGQARRRAPCTPVLQGLPDFKDFSQLKKEEEEKERRGGEASDK